MTHFWNAENMVAPGNTYILRHFLELDPSSAIEGDSTGFTLLHHAAAAGNQEAVVLLLDHGASPAAKNVTGWLPEQVASKSGHSEVAQLLMIVRKAQQGGAKLQKGRSWDEFQALIEGVVAKDTSSAESEPESINGDYGGAWVLTRSAIECRNWRSQVTDLVPLESVTGAAVRGTGLLMDRLRLVVYTTARAYELTGVERDEAERFMRLILRK
ncbi:MAG: ankyrin repeat domain-containing protein [Candidatus Limnocylindria bacterium]